MSISLLINIIWGHLSGDIKSFHALVKLYTADKKIFPQEQQVYSLLKVYEQQLADAQYCFLTMFSLLDKLSLPSDFEKYFQTILRQDASDTLKKIAISFLGRKKEKLFSLHNLIKNYFKSVIPIST